MSLYSDVKKLVYKVSLSIGLCELVVPLKDKDNFLPTCYHFVIIYSHDY
jgi:hypothetical protein